MEHGVCPDDSPDDIKEAYNYGVDRVKRLIEIGWDIAAQEKFMVKYDGEKPMLTGTSDLIMKRDAEFLFVDYKFGYMEVSSNAIQIKAYAWMGKDYFPDMKHAYGLVIQPAFPGAQMIKYSRYKDLDTEIRQLINTTHEGKVRNPSPEACAYCPLNGYEACPESLQIASDLSKQGEVELTDVKKLVDLYEKIQIVKKMESKVKDEIVSKLENGEDIEGYMMQPGRLMHNIENVNDAYDALKDDITQDEFMSVLKVKMTELRKILPHSSTDYLKAKLGPLLKTTRAASFLRRKAKGG